MQEQRKSLIQYKILRIVCLLPAVHFRSAADIFSIEERMSSMEDKLKGMMISLGSGLFSYREIFTALRDDIFSHPEKEWNVEAITHSIGLSKSHFHRIYRELFGTSCKEDIITSRMDKVKWLLDNTSLSIAQISEQCGYSNNSHFIRQFSSRMGITPSAYRRKKGQKSE